MAKRDIKRKQVNRLRKTLRSSLPASIDLIQYLKDRGHAQTTGQAKAIILAGRVRADSHKLGIRKDRVPKPSAVRALMIGRPLTDDDYEEQDVVDPFVPAKLRADIQVLAA